MVKNWIMSIFLLMLMSQWALAGELVTGSTKAKFESGDRVLFHTDFSKCPVGEVPENFDKLEKTIECVKYKNHMWAAPSSSAGMILGKKVDLGRGDFSIDFKVVPRDAGEFLFYLYQNNDKNEWDGEKIKKSTIILFQCGIKLEGVGFLRKIKSCYDKVQHIAINVRRKQFRLFVNGERIVSIPWRLEQGKEVTGFAIEHTERVRPYGYLVSDIRAARYTKEETKPTPEKLGIGVEKTIEGVKLTVPEKVLFDFNQFILKPEAKQALSVVGDMIRGNPVKKIIVTGYTDNIGSEQYNLKLSLQRAQSVADYLIYCEKINPKLFEIEGKGKANPIAPNDTEDGRAKNRRVEIRLIK